MKSPGFPFVLALGAVAILALAAPAASPTNHSSGAVANESYPSPPAVLPGKGLAQHDFLYAGEWDTRNPMETMFLVRGGKVVWTYQIPDKDPDNGQLSEYSDLHQHSNGDIVFA